MFHNDGEAQVPMSGADSEDQQNLDPVVSKEVCRKLSYSYFSFFKAHTKNVRSKKGDNSMAHLNIQDKNKQIDRQTDIDILI